MKTLSDTSLGYLLGKIKNAFFQKSESIEVEPLGIDGTPTQNSDNLITSGAVYTGLSGKQDEITSNNPLSYSLLSDTPTIPTVDQTYNPSSTNAQSGTAVAQAVAPCATKASGAVSGNFAGLDSSGNITDSGKKASDFLSQIFSYGMPQGDRWTIYGLKSGVTIPTFLNIPKYIDGIETAIIRDNAFEDGDTNITSVFIPSTIMQINRGAFFGCEHLSDVYYEGSETDWGNIIVGADNENLTRATLHYNQANATVDYVDDRLSTKENLLNKVTSLSAQSTDAQYPSAKCVYDIVGDIESALIVLRGGNAS